MKPRQGGVRSPVAPVSRLTRKQALGLLRDPDLLGLGRRAHEMRIRSHPEQKVTFVVDANPNYTNVCVTDCLFCAFYRPPGHPESYTHDIPALLERIAPLVAGGATTILLQGGHNPAIPFSYYVDLVRAFRDRFPGVHPHFFSPSEICQMSEVAGIPVSEVLASLKEAGLSTIPGGGAEVLSDRVKKRISPKKIPATRWLEVMREAHLLGYRTTATMMYGHVETDEDIVEHLDRVRELQDETGGFSAFIPWSFKPGNTPLEDKFPDRAGACRYLRILAMSRLYLDNVPHIQASWFSEGKKTGQVALHFGADDFGGTLLEENVHKEAGFVNTTTVEDITTLIREAGFHPAQRTTLYTIVKDW